MAKLKRNNIRILLTVVIIGILLFLFIQNIFAAPKSSGQMIKYRIPRTATLMAITGDLKYFGFIKNESALKFAIFVKSKLTGKEIEKSAIYEVSQSMNAWQIANILLQKGEPVDCDHGCPDSAFEPELLPGGDLAPTIKQKYEWVKNYDDCVKAIGHDGGQLSSEQYYQRTGIRRCVAPDGREFTQGKEGWSDVPTP